MSSSVLYSIRGVALALALTAGVTVAGDADALSRKDKRTLVGAVVGDVAGHVLSQGDPAMVAGGALAGGAIGNVTTPDRRDSRDYRHGRQDDRHRWEHQHRERDRHYRERARRDHRWR